MGLFGGRQRSLTAAQQVAAGGDGMDPTTVPHGDPRNRVFGDGSVGGIVGGIGKILSYGPFIGMAQEGMNRRRQLDDSNMQYKAAMAQHALQPDPGSVEKNYNFIKSINPAYADTFLRGTSNPMTMTIDPATGLPRWAPRAGPDPQAPVTKQLPNGQTAYWVNGAWYDNPEGKE